MTRSQRFLSTSTANLAAAPPPEAVTLESDLVVILAALLCAVICVVGLLAVARCAWLRRGSEGGGAGTGSAQSASANKGLKKKVLQSLPKYTYSGEGCGAGSAPKLAASECAICLGEFSDGDEIRVLPQCGHVFHVGCIDTWLGSHSSCPSCRQILVVARCDKCGQFPAISEAELKARQDRSINHNDHSAPPAPIATNSTSTTTTNSRNSFLP